MPNILLITVGGSHQPIVTALQSLNPDRVIFICSGGSRGSISQVTGEGKPCEVRKGTEVIERLPNIPSQAQLGDRFNPETDTILLDNPDDLSAAYEIIAEKIGEIRQQSENAQLLADYTGGTKTMSVALGMAALDYQLQIYLTTTTRTNLIKVERGESVRRAGVAGVAVRRLLEQDLPRFLEQYNYPAAIAALESLLREVEHRDAQTIEPYLAICRGLDGWDRFDHQQAWDYLEPSLSELNLKPLILFLKRVMGSRQAIAEATEDDFQSSAGMRGHGYELVEDLILNAERRASQGRYDDAVGRLYRALELLVQVRLWKEYGIRTGDVDLEKVPIAVRAHYEGMRSSDSKIQLALRNSYRLLLQWEDDLLGQVYAQQEQRLFDKLQIRNSSILAHGLRPVYEADYHEHFQGAIVRFLQAGLAVAIAQPKQSAAVQFPRQLF